MSERTFKPVDVPEWVKWGQREGAIVRPRPLGPNGRPLCGWCDTEIEGRRRRWCSDTCGWRFSRVSNWGALSTYIVQRDNETCQRCGTTDPPKPPRWRYSPWDVDHILPVCEGGTDDPDNLRLLCIPCHRDVTVEQMRNGPVDAEQLEAALFTPTNQPHD